MDTPTYRVKAFTLACIVPAATATTTEALDTLK